MALVSLYATLKASGNVWFSDVFQEVQKGISVMNWVKQISQQNVGIHVYSITEHAFL